MVAPSPISEEPKLETSADTRALLIEAMDAGFTPGMLNDGVIRKLVADVATLEAALATARDDEAGKIEAWLREADSVETTRNGHTFRQGLSYSERIAIVEFISTRSYRTTK